MPKKTFIKLSKNRKESFTQAFLKEFALHDYDNASISKVLKNLGIAKGSFYQYFDDKLDLFNYLIHHCSVVKMTYINNIHRTEFSTFWDYWFALIQAGFRFDEEHPIETNFLYNLSNHLDSPSLKEFKEIYNTQSQFALEKLIQPEINSGEIRSDLPVNILAYFLKNTNLQMMEFIKSTFNDSINNNIQLGQPLFGKNHQQEIEKIAHIYIQLMQSALRMQKQPH